MNCAYCNTPLPSRAMACLACGAPAASFTGRAWLLPRLLDWLEKSNERIFLLTGGPGSGKSTAMAWLYGDGRPPADPQARALLERIRAWSKAIHYCLANTTTVTPRAFAESIANQLTRSIPGFGQALKATLEIGNVVINQQVGVAASGATITGLSIQRLDLGNLSETDGFDHAFIQPLKKLYAGGYDRPLLLLVDALDEAESHDGVKLSQLLANLEKLPPQEFPTQVRLLASTRSDPRVTKYFPDSPGCDLVADAPQDTVDVAAYVNERLAQQAPELGQEHRQHIAGRLSLAAKGIFLYAVMVMNDLLPRLPGLPDLESYPLPDGLSGLYHDFFNRELGRDEERWYRDFRPVLGLIAVAQDEGLRRAQIQAIAGRDVEQTLRICRQYLSGELPEGPFRPFHQSLVDFLMVDLENLDYHIDAVQMHARIADYLWETYHNDWSRLKDAYGLDNLAVHLSQSGQFQRLNDLICQAWMKVRFENSGYVYDGFLRDLDLAWGQAYAEARREIEAGEARAAFAQNVRLALIRTSLNSLSSNYVPELVAQAVKTGLWSPQRAMSVAQRVTEPERQAELYAAILTTGRSDADLRVQAQERGLGAVLNTSGDEFFRTQALVALAPYLEGEFLERGLAAALEFKRGEYRAKVLATLAPKLEGKLLMRGLAAALKIRSKQYRTHSLAALAPLLDDAAREQALEKGLAGALTIKDERHRAEALAALGPHFAGELLARGLDAALGLKPGGPRAQALAALASRLEGAAREQLLQYELTLTLAIRSEWHRTEALAALGPHLAGDLLGRGLEAVQGFKPGRSRAQALAALALRLESAEHVQILQLELASMFEIEDEWKRGEILAALAPYLKGDLLERGLGAVLEFEEELNRAEALTALAPHLTGELLAHGLAAALEIEDRAEILIALAPHLKGELLERGLAAALEIEYDESRADILAALAPNLEGNLLKRGLEVALEIGYEGFRVQALAALASHLEGKERKQVLERDLAAALEIDDDWDRAEDLVALVPHLEGKLMARGLVAALNIEDAYSRANILAALVPRLEGAEREQALNYGLAAMELGFEEYIYPHYLAALGPYLVGEHLERGLAVALEIEDEMFRSDALFALAPHLKGELLERGLAAALEIEDEGYRAYVLAGLAPQLEGAAREQELAHRLAAAIEIKDQIYRAKALAVLAPHLEGAARKQTLEYLAAALERLKFWSSRWGLARLVPQLEGAARERLLARGLARAMEIEDEGLRAEALATIIAFIPDNPSLLRDLRLVIVDHLFKNMGMWKRDDVLYFLAKKRLFSPPVMEAATLGAIARHVIEICEEWTWL